eukprot:8934766-Prorocentrum_lima.AAC.1
MFQSEKAPDLVMMTYLARHRLRNNRQQHPSRARRRPNQIAPAVFRFGGGASFRNNCPKA